MGRRRMVGSRRTSDGDFDMISFPLRAGWAVDLEDRDVSFGRVDGVACVTIIISGQKADLQKVVV